MTIQTITIGNYAAIVAFIVAANALAWWALRCFDTRVRTIRASDAAVVAAYLLGVLLFTYEDDLTVLDVVLRMGSQVALCAYGWVICATRIAAAPDRRSVVVGAGVPLLSAWGNLGWCLSADSLARLAVVGSVLGFCALVVGIAVALAQRPILEWARRSAMPGTRRAAHWITVVIAVEAVAWAVVQPIRVGDPFNDGNLTRGWARRLVSEANAREICAWAGDCVAARQPGRASLLVDSGDWTAAIQQMRPTTVQIESRGVRIVWERRGRQPERWIIVQCCGGESDLAVPPDVIRVRETVFARRGRLAE